MAGAKRRRRKAPQGEGAASAAPSRRGKIEPTTGGYEYSGEVAETLAAVEKRYGKGVARRGTQILQPERIPFDVFMMDFALLGGIPVGRINQLCGNKHSGKSTMANRLVASAQKLYPDQLPVFIDVEKTYDAVWAEKNGVDNDRLVVMEADTGEMAVDMADAMLQSKETSLLVVDSLAALTPSKEMDDSAEDQHVGLQSRLIGRMCRKLNAGLSRERIRGHEVTVVFINQYRTKIGVMFGDPRTLPGGWAVEHFPSTTIQMKNKEQTGKDEDFDVEGVMFNEHAFKIDKNKVCDGPRTGEFRLVRSPLDEQGLVPGNIDDAKTMIAYAKKFGAWSGGGQKQTLAFGGFEMDFRTIAAACLYLYQNRDVYYALKDWLICQQAEHLGMPPHFLERFNFEVD